MIASNADWKRALQSIENEIKPQQFVTCNVIGDWVFNKHHSIFKVKNVAEIDEIFSQYFA